MPWLPTLYQLGRYSLAAHRLGNILYTGKSFYRTGRNLYRHGRKFFRGHRSRTYNQRMRRSRVRFRGVSRPYYHSGKYGTVLPQVFQPSHVVPSVPPMTWTDTAKSYFHSGLNLATNAVDGIFGTDSSRSVSRPSAAASGSEGPRWTWSGNIPVVPMSGDERLPFGLVRRRDGSVVGGPDIKPNPRRLRGHDSL